MKQEGVKPGAARRRVADMSGQSSVTGGRKCGILARIFKEIDGFCSGKREAPTVVASPWCLCTRLLDRAACAVPPAERAPSAASSLGLQFCEVEARLITPLGQFGVRSEIDKADSLTEFGQPNESLLRA